MSWKLHHNGVAPAKTPCIQEQAPEKRWRHPAVNCRWLALVQNQDNDLLARATAALPIFAPEASLALTTPSFQQPNPTMVILAKRSRGNHLDGIFALLRMLEL